MLIAQIEDLNELCVKISRHYLLYFPPRNKPSKAVTVGPDRFIVSNDLASPKMVIKMHLHFSNFYKVLELIECRRRELHMTANRNFVRFAHS